MMRNILAIGLLAAIGACDSTTAPVSATGGSYALATANGAMVPTDVGGITMHSGRMNLRNDHTYTYEVCYSAQPCAVEYVDSGDWTLASDAKSVTLTPASGGTSYTLTAQTGGVLSEPSHASAGVVTTWQKQ